jgi:hypothetical protein
MKYVTGEQLPLAGYTDLLKERKREYEKEEN